MTVSQQSGRFIFTGNDSKTEFSYSHTFFAASELKLVHFDTLTNTETVLQSNQYEIAYEGDPPYTFATIIYPLSGSPMTYDEQLIVYRDSPLSQEMDLTNQQAYFLESIEAQLDRMTLIAQNLQDQVNRALVLPVSTPTWKEVKMGPPVAEGVLRWPQDISSGDLQLDSVDLIDLIVDDARTQQVIEVAFESELFDNAWAREFGEASTGAVNTGFNADQVDGHDVEAGATPSAGLLKVGDYGATLTAVDIGGADLNSVTASGNYCGSTFTNAPWDEGWFIEVNTNGVVVSQRATNYVNAEYVYTRAYENDTWSAWQQVWAGTLGSGSNLNADQVDGYDVDSSPVPNSGLLKVGDWGVTRQALNLTGFDADTFTQSMQGYGTSMTNAPDTGAWFISAIGDGTTVFQTAYSQTTGDVRTRYHNGASWSSWTAAITYDDHTHTEVDVTDLDKYTTAQVDSALELKADTSLIGAASGICPLDGSGLVDESHLPSYVDDVIEAADYASLPGTGETGKIYVTLDTGNIYRWTGAAYIEINTSVGTADEAISLATARSISLGGDATGSANFDGTANITITANVLDSEALGGVAAANYLRSDVADSVGGVLTFAAAPVLNNNVLLSAWDTSPALRTIAGINGSNQVVYGNTNLALALFSNGTLTHNGATVWTSGNDGLGSALDAGLLGGALPSAYATLAGTQTFTGTNTFDETINIYNTSATNLGLNITRNSTPVAQVEGQFDGLWLNGSQVIKMGTGGTERFRIGSTGVITATTATMTLSGNTVYHTGNDSNLAKLNVDNNFVGSLYIENSKYLLGSNVAGTVDYTLIGVDASNIIRIGTTSAQLNLRNLSANVTVNGTDTVWTSGNLDPLEANAVSGSFTTTDGKTITVVDGQITAIV